MNQRRLAWIASVATLAVAACGGGEQDAAERAEPARPAPAPAPKPVVVLETTKGEIAIELEPESAPASVENFLQHVRAGFYDGLIFHRIARDFVIQAGAVDSALRRRSSNVFPIPNEASNGLQNLRGTVAMARTGDPHSATTEFFINLRDNPKLDFRDSTAIGWGYAVFGRVVAGMDVVAAIAAPGTRPRSRYPEFPAEPVTILRAYVHARAGES